LLLLQLKELLELDLLQQLLHLLLLIGVHCRVARCRSRIASRFSLALLCFFPMD